MIYVHTVAVLAILQFIAFGILVGVARGKHGVKAPAMTGSEAFERAVRVHANTLEQLVCFLPALFLAAIYWSPAFVSLTGAVYLVGRLIFRQAYVSDPSKRALGFMLTLLPTVLLLAAALLGAVLA